MAAPAFVGLVCYNYAATIRPPGVHDFWNFHSTPQFDRRSKSRSWASRSTSVTIAPLALRTSGELVSAGEESYSAKSSPALSPKWGSTMVSMTNAASCWSGLEAAVRQVQIDMWFDFVGGVGCLAITIICLFVVIRYFDKEERLLLLILVFIIFMVSLIPLSLALKKSLNPEFYAIEKFIPGKR